MPREEFEKLAEEGFEALPEWVKKKIKNVALLVEDKPSREVRKREGLGRGETLLGYYQGIPLSARGEQYGVGMTMPDTITIYMNPILEAAADELDMNFVHSSIGFANLDLRSPNFNEAVRRIVSDTIWHEFAHHFGMDEHEVRERELKRDDS